MINVSQIAKTQLRIVMQDKIFKFKIFEVTHKSVKSVKVFSLEIFRLYGMLATVELAHELVLVFLVIVCYIQQFNVFVGFAPQFDTML